MKKQPEQIVKELFEDTPAKERNKITKALILASKKSGKDFEELVYLYKEKHDKERADALPFLLNHCLITALLVESNSSLVGTYFDGYYNTIIKDKGKSFMNAQNKLYLKEFNSLATSQEANINDLLRFKEITLSALSNSFDEDFDGLAEVIDVWSKNKEDRKRILGIIRKIKKTN